MSIGFLGAPTKLPGEPCGPLKRSAGDAHRGKVLNVRESRPAGGHVAHFEDGNFRRHLQVLLQIRGKGGKRLILQIRT